MCLCLCIVRIGINTKKVCRGGIDLILDAFKAKKKKKKA